jgi:signal transduction histidine kinase
MLSNLVSNAIQHGARDMPVAVAVNGLTDEVELHVHNSGRPIPPAARATLFEPLRQSPPTGEDKYVGSSGLGLGLYIAREIAVAHGGSIELESNEAHGTTFTARLPRQTRIERRRT